MIFTVRDRAMLAAVFFHLTHPKGSVNMTSLAVSNLTNAVAALATRLDLISSGITQVFAEMKTELNTVTNSDDDVAIQAAVDQINNVLAPKLDTITASLSAEATMINGLSSQMPTGSTAATTGAIGSTDGGTGVVGVPGTAADETQAQPAPGGENPVVQGTGIVGNTPSAVAETDPEPKAQA